MISENKVCCWLSWNLFLRIGMFLLLMGIPFGLYEFKPITIFQIVSGFGAVAGFYLFYHRNKIFEKQLTQKDTQYLRDSQFKNFLEATKMLTDEKSTNEAKISALFLLYDVTKDHPENVDRVIQVINKQLTPLFKYLENGEKQSKYIKELKEEEIIRGPGKKEIKTIFQYKSKTVIDLDSEGNKLRKKIKEWKYKGNNTEKLISISLDIIKKIIIDSLEENNFRKLDLSNTIIFDLDVDFNKCKNFYKITDNEKPIENIVFLECNLHDVSFSNVIYHYGKFINCNLNRSEFIKSNLWGTKISNSKLEKASFKDCECEGVEFRDNSRITYNQAKSMDFQNRKNSLNYFKREFDKEIDEENTYLFIYDEEFIYDKECKREITCFKDENKYKEWKNSNKND